jgi:hypothetical protein
MWWFGKPLAYWAKARGIEQFIFVYGYSRIEKT